MDLLLRMRRKASIVAFNNVLPNNFKLLRKHPERGWIPARGVAIDEIANFELVQSTEFTPAVLSPDLHANVRISKAFAGWDGLFIQPGDPDFDDGEGAGDVRLNNSKIKKWFLNNGGEITDNATKHPRSGRTDMRWGRWTDGTEWVEITFDAPALRRRVWM